MYSTCAWGIAGSFHGKTKIMSIFGFICKVDGFGGYDEKATIGAN